MPVIKTLKNGAWTPVNSVDSLATATSSTDGLMAKEDKEKLDSVYNFVVEETVEGSWRRRKWNNGMAECWLVTPYSFTGTASALMGGYYIQKPFVNIPNIFNTTPIIINGTGRLGTGIGFVFAECNSINTMNVFLWGNQNSNDGVLFSLYIIGTWK